MVLFAKILFGTLAVILLFAVLNLMGAIEKFFRTKERKLKADPNIYGDRLEVTVLALQTIDTITKREVDGKVLFLHLSHMRYNMLDIDKDVEKLGNYIFNSFKREFYQNDVLLLSEDYIMKYITSQVSLLLITAMKEANIEMYTDEKKG